MSSINIVDRWRKIIQEIQSKDPEIFCHLALWQYEHYQDYIDTDIPLAAQRKQGLINMGFYIHEYKGQTYTGCHCDQSNCGCPQPPLPKALFYRTFISVRPKIIVRLSGPDFSIKPCGDTMNDHI